MTRQTLRKTILFLTFGLFHAFKVFHLFMSPVLIVFAAHQGIVNGSFVIFVTLFLLSLIFGRAFCSWVCPGGGLQELHSLYLPSKPTHPRFVYLKLLIFAVWVGLIAKGFRQAGGFHSFDLTYGLNVSGFTITLILFFGAYILTLIIGLIGGRWAFCHYLCWIAALMVIGTKIKNYFRWTSLRLESAPNSCHQCSVCDKRCSMNLNVSSMVQSGRMENMECVLCGACVDACPSKAIRFVFWR